MWRLLVGGRRAARSSGDLQFLQLRLKDWDELIQRHQFFRLRGDDLVQLFTESLLVGQRDLELLHSCFEFLITHSTDTLLSFVCFSQRPLLSMTQLVGKWQSAGHY
jgi:hypothetical protein